MFHPSELFRWLPDRDVVRLGRVSRQWRKESLAELARRGPDTETIFASPSMMRRWRSGRSPNIAALTGLPTWPCWQVNDVAELLRRLTEDERDELWCRWVMAGHAEWARPIPVTRQLAVHTSPGYERAGIDVYAYKYNYSKTDMANPLWAVIITKLFAEERHENREMFQKIVTLAMTDHERCILIDIIAASGVAVCDWVVEFMQQYQYHPCGPNNGLILPGHNINNYEGPRGKLTKEWCQQWNQMVLTSGVSAAVSIIVKDRTPGREYRPVLSRQQQRYFDRQNRKEWA